MVKFFSWVLVFCFVLYLIGTVILIPINEEILGPFLFIFYNSTYKLYMFVNYCY